MSDEKRAQLEAEGRTTASHRRQGGEPGPNDPPSLAEVIAAEAARPDRPADAVDAVANLDGVDPVALAERAKAESDGKEGV